MEGLRQGSPTNSNCLPCCGGGGGGGESKKTLFRRVFAVAPTRTDGGVPQGGGIEVERRGKIQDVCGR